MGLIHFVVILFVMILLVGLGMWIYKTYFTEDFMSVQDDYLASILNGDTVETYTSIEGQQNIEDIRSRIQTLIDDQIEHPVDGTDASKWEKLKIEGDMQNIQDMGIMDKVISHSVAYTVNKGDVTKVQAEIDPDTNTYILIHELAHAYDPKYQTNKHDTYFWILFSKLVERALKLGIIDQSLFDEKRVYKG